MGDSSRKANMHNIDMSFIEMTLDVMKYVIHRLTHVESEIGSPKKEAELKKLVGDSITKNGIGGEYAFSLFKDILVPATVPIDHPRHLAFVPAAPTRASIMFDLVTAASSIHGSYWMEGAGGIFCEMEAMRWLVSLTGLPEGSFGVFTSGGTAANLSALVAARSSWRDKDERRKGLKGLIIASSGAHSSIKSMAEVMDVDLILAPNEASCSALEMQECIDALSPDERSRLCAIVTTAGTTNAGIIDDLIGIGNICKTLDIWYHVDAAYGGGALVSTKARGLLSGIKMADSITIDPHKWFFAPYDCGAILYRDMTIAKKAHAQAGSYLEIFKDEGAQGFNPSEYQIQLTRRLRGMPLWFSLAMHGTNSYERAVDRGLELAQLAATLIEERDFVELVRPVGLSCVLYRRIGWQPEDYTEWTYQNHKKGYALVTPTKWTTSSGSEMVSRFCFINPDTSEEDIIGILESMR